MDLYHIYKITNLVNGKHYIGFTKNVRVRFSCHRTKRKNTQISLAIQKYGKDNFSFEVIYSSKDKDHTLNVMERYFIEQYNSYHKGYNGSFGGEANRLGMKNSEESKRKISKANKGKQSRLGAVLSEETKNKIRLANIGKTYSEEVNKKKGSRGSKHGMFGKKHSKKTRKKISQRNQAIKKFEVTINGVTYHSKRVARKELKVSYKTLDRMLQGGISLI